MPRNKQTSSVVPRRSVPLPTSSSLRVCISTLTATESIKYAFRTRLRKAVTDRKVLVRPEQYRPPDTTKSDRKRLPNSHSDACFDINQTIAALDRY